MTTPGKERRGVGVRKLVVFPTYDGYIGESTTTTTLLYGTQAVGAQELNLNDPDPTQINHLGDDEVIDVDYLPAQEGLSAGFTISGVDDDLDELFSDRISVTEGETRFIGVGTDKEAEMAQVAIVVYRQSLNADSERNWEAYVIPKAKVKPVANPFNAEAETSQYRVYPQKSSKDITGRSYAVATDGFTKAQMRRAVGESKLVYATARGDGSNTAFTFDSSLPAINTDKITVWVDGSQVTTAITKATTGVSWTTAPTTGAVIIFHYETDYD
jgi:hypothetical protein